jgi:hypothetical protein
MHPPHPGLASHASRVSPLTITLAWRRRGSQETTQACRTNADLAIARSDARRVLADRQVFVLTPEQQAQWEAINDRPARDLPSLRRLLEQPLPWTMPGHTVEL